MQHPTQFMSLNFKSRVPIEFPNKSFFSGKPESVWYFYYRSVLFWII